MQSPIREPVPRSIGGGKRLKRMMKKVYLRLPLRPVVRFVYAYVVRGGFLDGRPGLIFCLLLAYYDFLCNAKRYERSLAVLARVKDRDPKRITKSSIMVGIGETDDEGDNHYYMALKPPQPPQR